jgi:hypothetical protein
VYPALYYPEVYLLHLGYKEFFQFYPELCTGRYTAMVDPNHEVSSQTLSSFTAQETVLRIRSDKELFDRV